MELSYGPMDTSIREAGVRYSYRLFTYRKCDFPNNRNVRLLLVGLSVCLS